MSIAFYKLYVPSQSTVTAETMFFDLFNVANSGLDVYVHHIYPVVSGDVAVTGTLGIDMHLVKTTSVGGAGTAAVAEASTINFLSISAYGHSQKINLSQVSARLTPTSGATGGGLLSWGCAFTEETAVAAYVAYDLLKRGDPSVPPLRVKSGTGIKVVQGSVAMSGNVGFDLLFSTRPSA